MPMILKPQDIFIALKLLVLNAQPWSYVKLAYELSMSASEINAGVKRSLQAGLLIPNDQGKQPYPNKKALEEFLIHGIKYAFPIDYGQPVRGMKTMHAAKPFENEFVFDAQNPPVWPFAEGEDRGPSISPLYKSVPKAAAQDAQLYELLVLVDMIRGGRARERKSAEDKLRVWLK